jgi:hypothetical protein
VGGSTKNVDSRLEGVDKCTGRLELYKSGMCGSLAQGQPVSETDHSHRSRTQVNHCMIRLKNE